MSINDNKKSVIDLLKSKIRFRIFSILHLYPELSLSELSKKMGKSKSTIHHHIKELIKYEIIELSRQEKVRGNIFAKYYSLKPGYRERLNQTGPEQDNITPTSLEIFKSYLDFALRTLQIYTNFLEIIETKEGGLENLKNILTKDTGFSSMLFLSEEQFKRVLVAYHDFIKEVFKIEAEENNLKDEKPYYIFTIGLPLKKVIEEISNTS